MSDETVGQRRANADARSNESSDSALAVVGTLMDERRKYESWLAALAARRGTTPERVFTRVHADYSARQVRVLEVCQKEESECEPMLTCLDNLKPQTKP
jgi:hypothetical protein